jgi:hypothetical protein
MTKYTSGRQKNLKVGLSSYSENLTSLEVIGKVGIGTANATSSLHVVGDEYVTGVVTAISGFSGNLTGTAATTTNIPNLSGDVSSINTVTTLATVNSDVGTFGSDISIPTITVNAKGLVTAASENSISVGDGLLTLGVSGIGITGSATFTANQPGPSTFTVTSNATSANDNSTIVARDTSGNFSAGIITATQFSTGTSGIGINTNTISGPATLIIDPAGVGDNTGKVVIKGDFQVDGTQTIINSTTVTVDDKNIQIADGAINDMAADGAGITINSGEGNKTFQFSVSDNEFVSNISLGVANGKGFNVDGSEVLSSTTLASSVVNSYLTSVGTLGQLKVSGFSTVGALTATSIGIGTDNISSELWVNGDGYFVGVVTASNFYVDGSLIGGGSISGDSIVGTGLSIAGIGTIGRVDNIFRHRNRIYALAL